MRNIILSLSVLVLIVSSCKPAIKKNDYDVRIDFRFGNKFVSYKLNRVGKGYALKGHCSNYTESFKSLDSTISLPFKFDTVQKFYSMLQKLQDKPVLQSSSITDGPRTEIYYKGIKIYDVYFGDSFFWDLFNPLMREMPKGYSPFRPDDNVFN